jgi:hypothetical protein
MGVSVELPSGRASAGLVHDALAAYEQVQIRACLGLPSILGLACWSVMSPGEPKRPGDLVGYKRRAAGREQLG